MRSLVAAGLVATIVVALGPCDTSPPPPPPTFHVTESVEQLAVTDLAPGATVTVHRATGRHLGRALATATADDIGSALFRELRPGHHYAVSSGGSTARDVTVHSVRSSKPTQSLYDGQDLVEGFQYLETRDGTQLSINVVLPGPPEDGPYPTVVEYSGYDPSNPVAGLGGRARWRHRPHAAVRPAPDPVQGARPSRRRSWPG